MDGLIEEFETAGYEVISGKRFEDLKQSCSSYGNLEIDPDIKAVVRKKKSFFVFFRHS
jgi:hypothetical protein